MAGNADNRSEGRKGRKVASEISKTDESSRQVSEAVRIDGHGVSRNETLHFR